MIVRVEQGTEKWKALRRSRITATDASVISGSNPYKTLLELWEEKLLIRPEPEMNDAMRRGVELEPKARELFNENYGYNMVPAVHLCDDRPWQMASLDGWNDSGILLEIKCPSEHTHNLAIKGTIKDYYMVQMMHQFCVTRATKGYYCSYRPESQRPIVVIGVEPVFDLFPKMIEQQFSFYMNHICQLVAPPPPWLFEENVKISNKVLVHH